MSQSESDQLKLFDLGAPVVRLLLIVPVALVLIYAWFATRWYVGNFVADFAPKIADEQRSEDEVAAMRLEAAQAAMHLAPNDPLTHRTIARLKKLSFLPDDLSESVKQYEEAVRLSPNDYSLWMELGRTREQAGDGEGGERALRRAVELAPSYAYPRWYYGNLLLRLGRGDEAFLELRRAADAYPEFRPQIFNAAWSFYNEDVDAINKAAGGSAAARAELAVYVARRNRFTDAMRLWSSLTGAEKKGQQAVGTSLMDEALKAKHFQIALSIFRDLSTDVVESAKSEQFLNPGFELDVEATGQNAFGWKVTYVPQAQIAFDSLHKHSGARSLLIVFKSPAKITFNNVSQLVVVEPATQYRLEFYVRTEDLKSASTPVVQVFDGVDETNVLAFSQPLPTGTQDWQLVTLDFKTPPKTEAIIVRIVRGSCGEDSICPIFGNVWYDDFNLQRTGGSAGGNASGKTNVQAPAR